MRLSIIKKNSKGFTLIEIILAILIFSIVGIISMAFITQLLLTNQTMSTQMVLVDEANLALEYMTRDLRDANEDSGPVSCGSTPVYCVISTGYSSITFDKELESPVDATRIDTNITGINYALNGTTLERTSNGITSTVATGVTAFTVTQVSRGLFRIQLTITSSDGISFNADTAVRMGNSLSVLNIAFIVNNPASLHASREVPLNDHLTTTLGHTVTTFDDDDQTWTPTDYDVLVFSAQGAGNDDAWLSNVAVPVVTVDAQNFDEFGLGTARSRNAPTGNQTINIVLSHFITQPFPLGDLTIATGGQKGWISGFANDVTKLAHYASQTTRARLLVVDSGGTLTDGVTTAPAKRVFYGAREFGFATSDGEIIFNRALNWAVR